MEFIKVRKKPVEVKAFQLPENLTADQFSSLCETYNIIGVSYNKLAEGFQQKYYIEIKKPHYEVNITHGHWLIIEIDGDIYPCKDHIFRKSYKEG